MVSLSKLRAGVGRLTRWFQSGKTEYPDVVSIHNAHTAHQHLDEVICLRDGKTLHAGPPRELTRHLPARQAYRLRDVHVWLDEGIVMTPGGELVAETLPSRYRLIKRLRGGAYDMSPPPRRTMDTIDQCTSLKGGQYHGNYYHWWVDEIPRLQALHQLGETPVATVPSAYPDQLIEIIQQLAPPGIQTRRAETRNEWVHAREFLFLPPMTADYCGYLPEDFVANLRKNVVEEWGSDRSGPRDRRCYVSRAGGSMRRVVNEQAVVQCLSEYGFETVQAEELSIREQVRRFSEASWIAGPHGAGLTNMMFSIDCTIVELFPGAAFTHYQWLSESLGHDYHSIVGNPENEKNADFEVDLSVLRKILDECA